MSQRWARTCRDIVRQAVDMAEVVVDLIKATIVSAAWSNAYIPIYGQLELVRKVRDTIKLVNDARSVITPCLLERRGAGQRRPVRRSWLRTVGAPRRGVTAASLPPQPSTRRGQ